MEFPEDCDNPRVLGFNWLNRIPGYQYYDTPEGEDCLFKVGYMNKLALYVGISAATLDSICRTKPVGLANIAGRYFVITFPLMAAGSTFASTACLSTSIRGKDDAWNYTFGGAMAGAVWGACLRNGTFGTAAGTFFAMLGYIKKEMDYYNQPFIPTDNFARASQWMGPWAVKWDFSLTKDKGPKGWKTSDD